MTPLYGVYYLLPIGCLGPDISGQTMVISYGGSARG